jgi:hypothetical protein
MAFQRCRAGRMRLSDAKCREAKMPCDDGLESEARRAMATLRTEVCRNGAEREAWDWAEDVCLRYVVDEAAEELPELGRDIRGFIAADMAYRIGCQLQEMAEDAHPIGDREEIAMARLALPVAKRLEALAKAGPAPGSGRAGRGTVRGRKC